MTNGPRWWWLPARRRRWHEEQQRLADQRREEQERVRESKAAEWPQHRARRGDHAEWSRPCMEHEHRRQREDLRRQREAEVARLESLRRRSAADDSRGFVMGMATGVPVPFSASSVLGASLHPRPSTWEDTSPSSTNHRSSPSSSGYGDSSSSSSSSSGGSSSSSSSMD